MKRGTIIGLALVLAVVAVVSAIAVPAPAAEDDAGPEPAVSLMGGSFGGHGSSSQWKYTQADLRAVEALKTEGYAGMGVGEFDKLAADWTDETVFHQREAMLQRLLWSYEENGKEADFILLTLDAAFEACRARHYGGHCTQIRPGFSDGVTRVREEDVFGDKYPVFEAELSYTVAYSVPDETKLTVGERDKLFLSYRAAMQKLLDGKTEKELLDQKAMEKVLKKELTRLDKSLSTGKISLTGTSLDYFYAYDRATDAEAEVS